jgi:hypothetical protein
LAKAGATNAVLPMPVTNAAASATFEIIFMPESPSCGAAAELPRPSNHAPHRVQAAAVLPPDAACALNND